MTTLPATRSRSAVDPAEGGCEVGGGARGPGHVDREAVRPLNRELLPQNLDAVTDLARGIDGDDDLQGPTVFGSDRGRDTRVDPRRAGDPGNRVGNEGRVGRGRPRVPLGDDDYRYSVGLEEGGFQLRDLCRLRRRGKERRVVVGLHVAESAGEGTTGGAEHEPSQDQQRWQNPTQTTDSSRGGEIVHRQSCLCSRTPKRYVDEVCTYVIRD